MFGLAPRKLLTLAAIFAATIASAALALAQAPGVATFVVAGAALAGLAWIVSEATEALGQRFGPAVTGVLQSTLGNLPELFVVLFALRSGEIVVAQTSILGSLFANALLVLGLVILAGTRASEDGVMRFRKRLPQDTSTLLLLSIFTIALLALATSSHDPSARHSVVISAFGAVLLIFVYAVWIRRYLRGDHPDEAGRGHEAEMRFPVALVLLGAAGVGAAFVSDWFVGAIGPAIEALHISRPFAGLVIVAIAGNAVENVAGIVLASKGQADLAISVVKNSVAQVAAFLFPALVLLSLPFATHLTFVVAPVYVGALVVTALALWQMTGDGEAYAFEGWALIALFAILAAIAFFE